MIPSSRREFLKQAGAVVAATTLTSEVSAEPAYPGIVESYSTDTVRGLSEAVVVTDAPLLHTEQILQPAGAAADGTNPLASAFDRLEIILKEANSSFREVVKFNFYVNNPELMQSVPRIMSEKISGGGYRPAVCYVNTGFHDPRFDFAVDCVAKCRKRLEPGKVLRIPGGAILPPQHQLYVSGDARSGNLEEATRATLEGLENTLKFAGLDWSHVVQLKSFMEPIAEEPKVREIVRKFFGDRPVPVQSFVEWKSPSVPIEIELIAAVPPELGNKSGDTVEYLTPPGMTASPVFSRAARINSKKTIYVSGLYAEHATDAPGKVREILKRLDDAVTRCGGDMKHLVKATYYVADDEISSQLGKIRPEFYDPGRPPAASKAMVRGVGREGHSITLDMIAVPKP